MSRLDDECIVAVVRNRSGIDSGEIDYTIPLHRFNRQKIPCLREVIKTLEQLKEKCIDRIYEVGTCKHDWISQSSALNQFECTKCGWTKQEFNKI